VIQINWIWNITTWKKALQNEVQAKFIDSNEINEWSPRLLPHLWKIFLKIKVKTSRKSMTISINT
jgi:hypothetical protein